MTRGSKYLTWFLVQAGLLGAAFGGGYLHRQRTLQPQLQTCEQRRATLEAGAKQSEATLAAAMRGAEARVARGLIMESEVGLLLGNPAYASERLLRAQLTAQRAGLKLDAQFDSLTGRLLGPDSAQAGAELLVLADKVAQLPLTTPTFDASKVRPPSKPGEAGKAAPAGEPQKGVIPGVIPGVEGAKGAEGTKGAEGAKGAAGEAGKGPVGEAGKPAARPTESGATLLGPAATAALSAAPATAAAPASDGARRALEDARRSLLDAKVAVVGGAEPQSVIAKLAQARVMLNEGGRTDLDETLDGAIAAARLHDDAKLRGALDSSLKLLR